MKGNKLLLVDGNSLVYRAYYGSAYSKSGILMNSDGTPVNAIIVFGKMINKLITKYSPTNILVAFDAGKKTIRHDKYPEYKAGRSKTPEELLIQMPIIKEMLSKMNIKHFELDGIEADDIIGTIAKKYKNEFDVFVTSSDKDMFQLVDNNISIICPQNGNKDELIYNIDNFKEKFGYTPSQVIDLKGLMGDSSDNLPGIKGIGKVGAKNLIEKYGDMDNIYKNINDITGSTKTKLLENKAMGLLSKELATIDTNVKMNFNFDDTLWTFNNMDPSLIDFLENLGVKSLIKLFGKYCDENSYAETLIF